MKKKDIHLNYLSLLTHKREQNFMDISFRILCKHSFVINPKGKCFVKVLRMTLLLVTDIHAINLSVDHSTNSSSSA